MTVADSLTAYIAPKHVNRERRRWFVDELKGQIPIYPVTESTAEIVAQVGGQQAAKGIKLPLLI